MNPRLIFPVMTPNQQPWEMKIFLESRSVVVPTPRISGKGPLSDAEQVFEEFLLSVRSVHKDWKAMVCVRDSEIVGFSG